MKRFLFGLSGLGFFSALVLSSGITLAALTPSTTLVSFGTGGTQATGGSTDLGNADAYRISSISADGRYIAFQSDATNMVTGDTNGVSDIFVRDTSTGSITRASVASDGTQANADSNYPSISPDGRYVVFVSTATNLVSGSTNPQAVYIHNLQTGQTSLISATVSGDPANGTSFSAPFSGVITPDDRFVTFSSNATNIVQPATTEMGVYIRNLTNNTTTYVAPGGIPTISDDGNYVAFSSESPTFGLTPPSTQGAFIRNMATGQITRIDQGTGGNTPLPGTVSGVTHISPDGSYAIFNADSGVFCIPSAFTISCTYNYVYNIQSGTITLLDKNAQGQPANGPSGADTTVSGNSRYIAFATYATDLAPGVPGQPGFMVNIEVWDSNTGLFTLESVSDNGTIGNGTFSEVPELSYNGEYLSFESTSTNLTSNSDTNNMLDVFLRDRGSPYTFTGFFAPYSNPPTFNLLTVKGGNATAAIKFSLGGDFGLNVLSSGSPTTYPIDCTSGASTGAPVAASGTLAFDSTSQQYTYTLNTDRTWKKTCRAFSLGLNDGSTHLVYFKFK